MPVLHPFIQQQRDRVLAVLVEAWPQPVGKKQMLAACLQQEGLERQQQIVRLAEAIRDLMQCELIRFVEPVESGMESGAWAISEQFVGQSMVIDNDVSADFQLMSICGDDRPDAQQDNEQWPTTERQTLRVGASDGR